MALQDLVGSECGRNNPLTHFTSHFLLDQTREEHGLCRASSSTGTDQMVQEYLEEVYGQNTQTFRMDSLFHEMNNIESAEFPEAPTPGGSPGPDDADLGAIESSWVQEYLGSRKPSSEEYHEEIWATPSYKPDITQSQNAFHHGFDSIWAPEYRENTENILDIDENWLQESEADEERQGSLQELAKMFLNSVDDPKLKGSKFMKFMQQVGNGDISISGGQVTEHTQSEGNDGSFTNVNEDVNKDGGTSFTPIAAESSITGLGTPR